MATKEVIELERQCQIADAELGVAEELGFATAGFAAMAVYLKWDSWLIMIAAGVIVYGLAVRRYDKKRNVAWDSYQQATKTGKYYLSNSDT